jgi:murein DD-endopeptidase MepM/ murein hydrolase activator NlpD
VNQGEEIIALRYTDSKDDTDYYAPNGSSMRKAFLRTPISARVSSSFNLQRRHPVLDVVRPHEGTDYAAPPGTPIKAAGDGRVIFAGWKGGYGRTVVLQHGDNITTLYAHMNRLGRGIRNGSRVKQGDTVGHVGSSGMVTGPHLHYEFRVNGSPRNSRKVKLPDAKPVPKTEMARFQRFAKQEVAKLDLFRGDDRQQLAMASDE